jgi:hypothetical protein
MLFAAVLTLSCGIKALPRPPLSEVEADAGTQGSAPHFPDAGCFSCPAGAQ